MEANCTLSCVHDLSAKFWIVQGLCQEDLARLLQFVTGTSQVLPWSNLAHICVVCVIWYLQHEMLPLEILL